MRRTALARRVAATLVIAVPVLLASAQPAARASARKVTSGSVYERERNLCVDSCIICVPQRDHALAQSLQYRFCTRADLHFHEDIRQVTMDGTNAQIHTSGDFLVGQAARRHTQYIKFALTKRLC